MTFDEILRTNGTCRYYKPDAVSDDVLGKVLDAARWAPSGGNRQPLSFVAVRDPKKKRALKELYLPIWNEFLDPWCLELELPSKVKKNKLDRQEQA